MERGLPGSPQIPPQCTPAPVGVWPALKQFIYALLVLGGATLIAHGWILDSARVASGAPYSEPDVVPGPVDAPIDLADAHPVEVAEPVDVPVIAVAVTPAPTHRRRAAPRGETTRARDIPPPLPATITTNVAELNLGHALQEIDPAALAGLSFVVEVRPDGHVDASSLVLSKIYGDDNLQIKHKLAQTRFPPSLRGSGDLVCYVVRKDSAADEPLRCAPRA